MEPFAVHTTVGYYRNENKSKQRRDVWQASLAASVEPAKRFTVVGEVRFQSNTDPTVRTAPAYLLGGFSYSVTDWITVDGAVKRGLNKQDTDRSYIAGVTLNF
jgi:hypothetical protein